MKPSIILNSDIYRFPEKKNADSYSMQLVTGAILISVNNWNDAAVCQNIKWSRI